MFFLLYLIYVSYRDEDMQSDASLMSGSTANDIAPLEDLEGDEDGEPNLVPTQTVTKQ